MRTALLGLVILFVVSCTPDHDYTFAKSLALSGYANATRVNLDASAVTLDLDGSRLKLRIVSSENRDAAQHLIDLTTEQFFRPYVSPYPGTVSQKVECPPDHHPVDATGKNAEVEFNGRRFFANRRFQPGECLPSLVKYRYYHGMLKCVKSSRLFEVEFFEPLSAASDGELSRRLQKFHCL